MTTIGKEAKVLFFDGDFDCKKVGDHVKCSVTGRKIKLVHLNYWSVDRQEAYASAQLGLIRQQRYA